MWPQHYSSAGHLDRGPPRKATGRSTPARAVCSTPVCSCSEWVQRRGQHGGATPHYDATPGASSGPGTDFGPASGGGRKKQKLGHSALPAPPTLQAPPPKERKGPPQQNLPAGGRGGAATVRKGRGVSTGSRGFDSGRWFTCGNCVTGSHIDILVMKKDVCYLS
jgi:hypothetical protein